MSLQGFLTDFGVAEVFQLIAQQRKTGVLEISSGERVLEVYFHEGMVVRGLPRESGPDATLADFLIRTGLVSEPALEEARRTQEETLEPLARILVDSETLREEELDRMRRLISHETIFELFLWDEGRFNFRSDDVQTEPGDEAVGAEQVLLDALRMRDEWSQVQVELPDLGVVFAPSAEIEQFQTKREEVAREAGLQPDDVDRLFRMVDGRLPARRVIDLARIGTFSGAKGLIALRHAGLLRVDSRARVRAGGTASGSARQRRRLQGAVGVLVLVVASLVAARLWTVSASASATHPVPADALREARTAAQADRVRLELEARRWLDGGYPQALEPLPAGGRILAPASPDRYIYARQPEGYTLHPVLP